jgi:uncharacterized protein YchJ
MSKLTPSEIIKFRAECHINKDGKGVFSLYSIKSDMRRMFDKDSFSEHFGLLTKNSEHVGLKIVREQIKGNLAEVKYIEYINQEDKLITYYSKTTFVNEKGSWKIRKEKREHDVR